MLKKNGNNITLLAASLMLLLSIALYFFSSNNTQQSITRAQNRFALKEKRSLESLNWLQSVYSPSTSAFSEALLSNKTYLDKEGIVLLAYRNDSLRFWTSNLAPVDASLRNLKENNGMVHLRNGWYEYFMKTNKTVRLFALLFIKPEYDVENSYFKNAFVEWLNLPEAANLKYPVTNPELSIKSKNTTPLFEINFGNEAVNTSIWPALLFFMAIVLFAFAIIKTCYARQIGLTRFLIFSVSILALRSLMIYFKLPALLYSTDLYNAYIYGITQSFYNEYLGDILINVVFFFVWSAVFYRNVNLNNTAEKFRLAVATAYLVIIILLAVQLNQTVKNLVLNSTISLDFSNFYNLTFLSFICIGIVFINGFSITIHIEKLIGFIFKGNQKKTVLFLIACFIIYSLSYIVWFNTSLSAVEWFWLPLLIFISVVFRNYEFTQSILSAGFRVLVFAIITSWIFGEYNAVSEAQNIKHLSEQLSDRQDAFLESEFLKVSEKIKEDNQLQKAIRRLPLLSYETEQMLRQIYFTRYFEKYNIQLAVFDSLCMPYFKNSDYHLNDHDYFDSQIRTGLFTLTDELFFIENYKSNSRYIAKIDFDKSPSGKAAYSLYVQLEPKQFSQAGSFSELLLDAPQQKQSRYKQFSYAIYKNGELNTTYGQYSYPKYFSASILSQNTGQYHHILTVPDKETQLILSSKNKGFNYYFTANSYYFLFYSLLGVIMYVLFHFLSNNITPFFTLNRRIQFFIVTVIFLALSAVGLFTVKLVINKSEEDQTKILTEKAQQIQNELNNQLFYNRGVELNSKVFTENVLQKYALLFNSDISLYTKHGYLFASSRPQLFNSGLSSSFINPLAVLHFNQNQSLYFITHDKIGSLNYLSLYTAVYDADKKLAGYINLPYFARQNDLEEGVSQYITTLINIYVVLFLISLFTGLVISVYITKPLRILQEQLAKITLGKKNEPIQWHSNDEIGRLVNEYNRMLLKLEESAVLLAKSEREGAWQEMAKQVAHEIKNPLTPMKLNLQYLQKVVGDNGVDFPERFKKVSDSLIEQIDTLAHIASEFSNFAKLPKPNLEKINLIEVLNTTIELFKNQNGLKLTLVTECNSAITLADKAQCLRVFNNLIKNAIQAIPENKEGKIEIVLKEEKNSFIVSIKDNGGGIPDEMKSKIFVPNFTTKSTGTGLGLAMVKNIINAFNGEIWFESAENEGTTFYLRFQKALQKG